MPTLKTADLEMHYPENGVRFRFSKKCGADPIHLFTIIRL